MKLGLFPEDRSVASGYNERWTTFGDLFRCRLAGWSTIVSLLHKEVSPWAVTITETEYSRLAYSKWRSNTVKCKLICLLLSSLFLQKQTKKQNVVFQVLEWRPAAGRRTSNALIPIVGDEAVNAEDHTAISDVEEPAYRRSKAKYAHKERERHKEYHYIHRKQQLQIRTTNLYKRLQSHFI